MHAWLRCTPLARPLPDTPGDRARRHSAEISTLVTPVKRDVRRPEQAERTNRRLARAVARSSAQIAAAALLCCSRLTSRLPRSPRVAADPTGMRCMWITVLLVAITGCHLRAGLDAASRANGPLHTLMTQSTVSRQDGVI